MRLFGTSRPRRRPKAGSKSASRPGTCRPTLPSPKLTGLNISLMCYGDTLILQHRYGRSYQANGLQPKVLPGSIRKQGTSIQSEFIRQPLDFRLVYIFAVKSAPSVIGLIATSIRFHLHSCHAQTLPCLPVSSFPYHISPVSSMVPPMLARRRSKLARHSSILSRRS